MVRFGSRLRQTSEMLVSSAFCAVVLGCAPAGLSQAAKRAEQYLDEHPEALHQRTVAGRTIQAVVAGRPARPKVLFIHGSPGSWDAFASMLDRPELNERATLVFADRPGYGGSGAGRPERSLTRQAEAMNALLDLDDPTQPAIVVGHSYGGPVAGVMAMGGDPRIAAAVLVAGSVDPKLEQTLWIQWIADAWAFRWMVPQSLDVCNQEILALKTELTAVEERWSTIRIPVTVLQGLDDELVPPGNADFLAARLPNAKVERIPDLGHFIPWQRPELITQAIVEMLDALEAPAQAAGAVPNLNDAP